MDVFDLWRKCSAYLHEKRELQTVTLRGMGGVWFCAEMDGATIKITMPTSNNARTSLLGQPRYIADEEFMRVARHYDAWRTRRETRKSIQDSTGSLNTSYIFALVYCIKQEER